MFSSPSGAGGTVKRWRGQPAGNAPQGVLFRTLMSKRFYPAVLERAEGDMFAIWFPDFPGCVAAGRSQEEAAARAEEALARALQEAAESEASIPEPTAFDAIVTPAEADVVSLLSIGASPPNPSERGNVYLPKNLIARADALAALADTIGDEPLGQEVRRLLIDDPPPVQTSGPDVVPALRATYAAHEQVAIAIAEHLDRAP